MSGSATKISLKAQLRSKTLAEADHPEAVRNALTIHNQTIAASNSFHSLFAERHRAGHDADDHYEQDLLRATLLFACSGLDAAIKQLVRDSIQAVIDRDPGAQSQFAKFIERKLKRGVPEDPDRSGSNQSGFDYALLSQTLASPQPRTALIEVLKRSLTSDSLQSRDQILKVAAHFALTQSEVLSDDAITKAAFEARNQLAHEMDIDFRKGSRRHRAYKEMVGWTENILVVSSTFIESVSKKLQ